MPPVLAKFNFVGLLCSLLLLAACHSDDNEPIPAGDEPQTVTLTIDLEDAYTRTISETGDNTISRLLMQVIDNDTPGTVEELTLSGNQATISLSLYASRSYTFLFWADDGQSYTYTDNLTDIALSGTPTGTQAEIAYAACIDWDKSATINATLKHAVSKVTLKTTNNVEAGKTLTLTVPHAVTGYNAQTGKATGTPAEYEHSITTTAISGATETTPKELFSFYILAADELQTLTIESNEGENTVPANLSGGKHIVLTGDIGNIANERPTSANLTVTVGEWGDQQLHPFGGKDQLTDATTASASLQGEGTETDPYRITSAADLLCYLDNQSTYGMGGKHALLYTDIEINAKDWDPCTILGIFDGGGHTISGTLTYDDTANSALFNNVLDGAVIKNLEVSADITCSGTDNSEVIGTKNIYFGGIATSVDGTITQCTYSGTLTVTATVTGGEFGNGIYIGGIAGWNEGTISYCTFKGIINAGGASAQTKVVGAIAGDSSSSAILTDNTESGTVNN